MSRPVFCAVALLVVGVSTPAAADDTGEIALATTAVGLAAADLSFSIRAALLAANDGDSQYAFSLSQTLLSVPQAIAFNGAIIGLMQSDEGAEAFAAIHIPATMATALAVHGLWSLATPDEDPRLMFLVSTAVGVNTMWSSFVVGTAFTSEDNFGDDGAPIAGIYEVLTTLPGVAVGIHQALESDRFQPGWIAMASWSGLLSLHGAVFATGALNPDGDDGEYSARHDVLRSVSVSPTSFGAPVEGAPPTFGAVAGGSF